MGGGCQGEGIATIASVFTLIKHALSINLGQDRQVAVYGDTSEGLTSLFPLLLLLSSYFLSLVFSCVLLVPRADLHFGKQKDI